MNNENNYEEIEASMIASFNEGPRGLVLLELKDLASHSETIPVLKEFINKYISSFGWRGEALLDGGWSAYKPKVQELIGDPLSGLKTYVYIAPKSDMTERYSETPDGHSIIKSEITNLRYEVSFPGVCFNTFLGIVEQIKNFGVSEQIYALKSYYSEENLQSGSDLYQLRIQVTKEGTTFTIEKGKWSPDFSTPQLIAGCEL